jgi:glucokinase
MDVGGTKVALAVCHLDGRCAAQTVLATRPEDGGQAVLERAIAAGQELLAQTMTAPQLAAVGVSTIGVASEDRVELAPAIPGWQDLALARSLEGAFGVPVTVATDVKAAATVEARWGALTGPGPGIYLNLGTGLGAAIVVDGHVLVGAHGAAGEIGYNLTGLAPPAPGPLAPGLAASGPVLEGTVSGMALSAAAARLLGGAPSAAEVFQGATTDPRLDSLITTMTATLSLHLVNLVIAVDPSRVAVGGGMTRSWSRLHQPLEEALKANVPFPPDLVLAAYPFNGPLVGALALALEATGASLAEGPRIPAI